MSEELFPIGISYGAQGGPRYNTDIVTVKSGRETRNQNWSIPRRTWDVSHAVKTKAQADELKTFFIAVAKGRLNTFRFRDWSDYKVTTDDGVLDNGLGDGTPTYQLGKVYVRNALSHVRTLYKIVDNTTTIYRGGSPATEGAGAGNYAIDNNTGIITFVADASSAASSITPGATTTVVLSGNPGTLAAGQRLYLTGFTGANASAVNSLAHVINSVTGTGPYTFVLATNTAGLTITLGSGTGRKYPQATETLTWSGEFHCNVRFDTDEFNLRIDDLGVYTWDAIPIIEVRP